MKKSPKVSRVVGEVKGGKSYSRDWSVVQKKVSLNDFLYRVHKIFEEGDAKYGGFENHEALMTLFGAAGPAWAIAEKAKRFINTRDSKDLEKIAAWAFLMWKYEVVSK